jgi:hypothetical protein
VIAHWNVSEDGLQKVILSKVMVQALLNDIAESVQFNDFGYSKK